MRNYRKKYNAPFKCNMGENAYEGYAVHQKDLSDKGH